MINYLTKDITSVETGIVAHGCNCQGKMGAGVALAIRKKWPRAYQDYKLYCVRYKPLTLPGSVDKLLGRVQVVRISDDPILIVANCFTQLYYGRNGRYADTGAITICLRRLAELATANDLSIYMPKIGCGLGGLNWEEEVLPIIENIAANNQVDINVLDIR